MRLTKATVGHLSPQVSRPRYDRDAQAAGIVHFGIGAFHRAHQAVYFDDVMNGGESGWAVIGVSLRSPNVAEQINPQDGLYTISTASETGADYRLVGAVRKVLVAPQQRAAVVSAIASPATHILSFTVTEKGYCRASDGSLDPALVANSIYPLLAEGLARRRESGMAGLTLLSCDNLAQNGEQLARLLGAYLDASDQALADWVRASCSFPSSMVDRIVPATTSSDLEAAAAALGLRDEAHVGTEKFSQWVIEDRFVGPRPRLEDHGVEIVEDIAPYETAKLRMLNGAHSALAYIGLLHGHEYVHQAIADPDIRPLIERLMREEAAPSIAAAAGQDLVAYAAALLTRFANPALNHRLIQIAMDGSQKLPQRWLETLAWHQHARRSCPAILTGIAAWLIHIRGTIRPVDDPMAAALAASWDKAGDDGIIDAIFARTGLLPSNWQPDADDRSRIMAAMSQFEH